MALKGFSMSGGNGTVTQLQDERGNVYTYDGVDAPGEDPEGVLTMEEAAGDTIQWEAEPLAGDWTAAEVAEYVGA